MMRKRPLFPLNEHRVEWGTLRILLDYTSRWFVADVWATRPINNMHQVAVDRSEPLWRKRILRLFGFLNIGFGLFGLYLMIETLWLMNEGYGKPPYATPYFKLLFWSLSVLQMTFSTVLLIAGVKLFRLRHEGMILSLRVFVVQIAYYLGASFALIALLPHRNPLLKSVDTAKTLTDIPLMPQVLTIYPVIGALAMLWLIKRSAKRTAQGQSG